MEVIKHKIVAKAKTDEERDAIKTAVTFNELHKLETQLTKKYGIASPLITNIVLNKVSEYNVKRAIDKKLQTKYEKLKREKSDHKRISYSVDNSISEIFHHGNSIFTSVSNITEANTTNDLSGFGCIIKKNDNGYITKGNSIVHR
jgi:hypothetical protein